jgi:phenylpropionate dioxygenase-like ring-hydroxylating dioxygenase large terminal subunit
LPQTTREIDFPPFRASAPIEASDPSAARYTSAEFMAREWETVWTKAWLFAGVEEDVKEPGDYFLYNIGRESIIVTRSEEGALRALFNVCQHRGNRLLTSPFGAIAKVTCPYHGWSYRLDGALDDVPDKDRFGSCVAWRERSLKPVRVEAWAGLVFINMDERALPLSTFLGEIAKRLAPYHLERMRLVKQQTLLLKANWKTLRDNFLEQYHVDFIHPQHATMVDCYNSANELYPFGHSSTAVRGFVTNPRYPTPQQAPERLRVRLAQIGLDGRDFEQSVSAIRDAACAQKRKLGETLGYRYDELNDEQVTDIFQYDLFPNSFMTIRPEEVWIYGARPHPTDPDSCSFDKWTLQIPSEHAVDQARGLNLGVDASLLRFSGDERPEPEVFSQEDVMSGARTLGITIDQDIRYLPDMQAGMHSRGFSQAILNEDEARIRHFHAWLDAWMNGAPWRA